MKMIRFLLLTCFLPLFAWQINAQTPGIVFSGNSLPTEQGWTEQKLDASVNSLAAPTTQSASNGMLELTSTNQADQFSQLNWYRTDLDLDFSKGFSFEIKVKIITADKTGAFNIQGFDKWGKGFRVGILSNAVTEQTNQFAATNVLASGLDNSTDFHTYLIKVNSSYIAEVSRDDVSLGTFPLQFFQFDNIIENGGFEDKSFPDFKSNGTLNWVNDPLKVRNGSYALEMDNQGLTTDGWGYIENARTRDIAIKPNAQYDITITRRRTFPPDNSPWAFRDMGAFYDTQLGVLNGVDDRNNNAIFASANDNFWQIHNQSITAPDDVKSLHFEFPSWQNGSNGFEVTTSFDNFALRENPGFTVGTTTDTLHGFPAVTLPEGYVNIIKNGDFEDSTMNNDGTPYAWALASQSSDPTSNAPTDLNPMWNGQVRIQDENKTDETVGGGESYAHNGTNCLRFSTLGNHGNFNFTVDLEAGKTYRFNFWHRSPSYDDWGWLKVGIGDSVIWGNALRARDNIWENCDLVFTTTNENKTLHLFTDSASHGDWWNIYLDDLVLYEIPSGTPIDPQIAGKTNLIANGDFEDVSTDNNGQPYTWALASTSSNTDDNYPVAWSDSWGSYVRLQDQQKIASLDGDADTGLNWAHSGTHSLRFSYLDDWGKAQAFENIVAPNNGDYYLPKAYHINMNFQKELEPNKTYTFVFWLKESNYPDQNGDIVVANGDVRIWDQQLSAQYIDWTRQSITFSTTDANHTLRLFTEFTGWMNFYLDDLFLYQENNYVPAPESNGISYLSFGKSEGTSSADVQIQSISTSLTGIVPVKVSDSFNIYPNPVVNGLLTVNGIQSNNSPIEIYSIMGTLVKVENITGSTATVNVSDLPSGTYIVKAGTQKAVMLKK